MEIDGSLVHAAYMRAHFSDRSRISCPLSSGNLDWDSVPLKFGRHLGLRRDLVSYLTH
jgi:hypothetical protein